MVLSGDRSSSESGLVCGGGLGRVGEKVSLVRPVEGESLRQGEGERLLRLSLSGEGDLIPEAEGDFLSTEGDLRSDEGERLSEAEGALLRVSEGEAEGALLRVSEGDFFRQGLLG